MPAAVHELYFRTKYILYLLHQILVFLLKFILKNHYASNKDLENVLSDIIKNNLGKFKATDLYKRDHYKKFFGHSDPNNIGIFLVKAKIPIDKLDVSSLCLLIQKDFIFTKTQNACRCCQNCKHNEIGSCEYEKCKGCNKECKVVHIKKFRKMVKCFRDCFSHDTQTVYESLASGKGDLEEFPHKNWTDLWEFIWEATSNCMNVIKDEDPEADENMKLISKDTFKNFEMEIRLGKETEIHYLLPKLANQINPYYKVILDAAELQNLDKHLKIIRNGIFLLSLYYNFFLVRPTGSSSRVCLL